MFRFTTGMAAAVVATLFVAGPARAADEKDKTKAAGNKAEVQKTSAGAPVLKYEQFRKKVEIQVAEKRESQIEGLKRLLDLGPDDKEIPDLKYRLAELYFEKSQFFFFRANEADDRSLNAKTPGAKDEAEGEKRRMSAEAQTWVKRATDLYKEIRDKYPKYARLPEVLYALGQSYWNAGRSEEAIEVFSDLIRNFKDNPLVADAWLAVGEYYFNEKELNKALRAYEFAATDKRNRVYGFALYKQAWCYYNLADWDKALAKFRATIFYSQMSDQLSGENRIALGREAQKDFVKTYAHVGDPGKAKFVFADLVEKEDCKDSVCLALVEQLANIWYDTGKFDESASLYKQLINLAPESLRNPYYQGRIVDLVSRGPDKKVVIQECRRLIEVYETAKTVVGRMTGNDEATLQARRDLDEAEQQAESTIRKLAQVWNREAKKTRQPKIYESARDMYQDYLKLFGGSKFAYEMRFQLADIHYKLEDFAQAAAMYEATVLADPKGKYVVDAANDNILAVEENLKDLRLPKPKGESAQEIHPERMKLVAACDRYIKFVPADKADKVVKIKFKAAKIFYDHNQFEEAIKRFDDIVSHHPEADESEFAANLVSDIYNIRKDWPKLYELVARYLKIDALVEKREKLKRDLTKFGEYAKFKLVQAEEEQINREGGGDRRRIASAYEEFQKEFPESENADKALFNASVAWDAAGEKERADMLRQRLVKEYKDSPLRADVSYYIAGSFEAQGEYEKAAELYRAFAEKYPDDPRARDAMYNAAVFFAGVGKVKEATALREEYLKKYGKAKGFEKEAASIVYSIAYDLERAEKWKDAASRYADFAKNFPDDDRVFEALWREANIRRDKLRAPKDAEKVEALLFATFERRSKKGDTLPPKAGDYASRIAFNRIDADFPKYEKLKIQRPLVTNPAPFQKSLKEKASAREQMIAAYTGVVTKYKQADSTIASLYKIAVSWDNFIETLKSVPCPSGLTKDQCVYFQQELIEQARPAEESAKQAYVTCVTKSNELAVFTQFSTRCVKALEKLGLYPTIEERTGEFTPQRQGVEVRTNGLILKPGAVSAAAALSGAPAPMGSLGAADRDRTGRAP